MRTDTHAHTQICCILMKILCPWTGNLRVIELNLECCQIFDLNQILNAMSLFLVLRWPMMEPTRVKSPMKLDRWTGHSDWQFMVRRQLCCVFSVDCNLFRDMLILCYTVISMHFYSSTSPGRFTLGVLKLLSWFTRDPVMSGLRIPIAEYHLAERRDSYWSVLTTMLTNFCFVQNPNIYSLNLSQAIHT